MQRSTSRPGATPTGRAGRRGIARGCELAGCALLGGETAEHPGTMPPGEYDLAGFAVGVVSRKAILDGSAVEAGDVVLGLESDGLQGKLGDELLRPTRIYAKAVGAALAAGRVRAMCHVTGGGLPGNVPRVLPDGLGAELRQGGWPRPPIFDVVAWAGSVAEDEMRRSFNLGIGYILVVAPSSAPAVTAALTAAGERPHDIGRIVPAGGDDRVRFT